MNTVPVNLGERSYPVLIGRGILDSSNQHITDAIGHQPARVFGVIDAGVPDDMAESLESALEDAGTAVSSLTFDPTEAVKSLTTWAEALEALAATGQERSDPVIALGGGIVGDVAGFVAASYRRGVPVVQCPSTLLAMVDASVGGKTGVNLEVPLEGGARLLKNLIGAFHQPRLVIADTALLDSLDPRQFRSGLAECIKHAMIATGIRNEDLLGWTEQNLDRALAQDHETLIELVTRSVALKADVVAEDEHETAASADGGRALLNLGHTFGHAIETLPGLSPDQENPGLAPLMHGEAVALGLIAACACSHHLGLTGPELQPRIESMLNRAGLPTRVSGLPDNQTLVGAMLHDKKTRAGHIRVVLPTGAGSARVVENPDPASLNAGLNAIRA